MYELFVVYTDRAALQSLLTINKPSERIIRRRLRMAELDFEVKYKNSCIIIQADALSRLHKSTETDVHNDRNEIPVSLLKLVNIEFLFNRYARELDVIDVQYRKGDGLLSTKEELVSP